MTDAHREALAEQCAATRAGSTLPRPEVRASLAELRRARPAMALTARELEALRMGARGAG
ncbi:MAG: hypothetical protein R3A48_17280 [Polyangiales bacterium]